MKLSLTKADCVLVAKSGATTWKIYLAEGQVRYIDCSVCTLAQIGHILCRQGLAQAFTSLQKIKDNPEIKAAEQDGTLLQQSIIWLEKNDLITKEQIQALIAGLSKDALESFFWLKDAIIIPEDYALPSWVAQITHADPIFDLSLAIKSLNVRLKEWQKLHAKIFSPYQRPYILNFRDTEKPVVGGSLTQDVLDKLAQLISRGMSIRQLSIILKQDELHLAQLLNPYVEQGVIFMRKPSAPFDALPVVPQLELTQIPATEEQSLGSLYKIVCIDDSPTILYEIKRFLQSDRYDVTTVDDPIQASSIIFRIKPDLIMLDITMPKINGYELCSLLRSVEGFSETPIIMVTGKTGWIDKTRAKLVGATDYMEKPFTKNDLNFIVDKYLYQLGMN